MENEEFGAVGIGISISFRSGYHCKSSPQPAAQNLQLWAIRSIPQLNVIKLRINNKNQEGFLKISNIESIRKPSWFLLSQPSLPTGTRRK
ncbi:MAG: hypothetical protein M3004_14195 [Bacteroidota bacterium]|nr:hypothetical protein [Bacteroidota bacterium]